MHDAPQPLPQSALDELWDFSDPALSEKRFAEARLAAPSALNEAELATQQARALGLQGRYAEGDALLDDIGRTDPVVEVRIFLERGRLLNSSGRSGDALPLFSAAADRARDAGSTFLQIDALHMVGIADPGAIQRATTEALLLVDATDDARTKRWAVALHNNLGWARFDDGRYDDALVEFEAALQASLQVGTTQQQFVARWAVARCLRALGRYSEALAIQERLLREDPADTYVVEELAALRAERR